LFRPFFEMRTETCNSGFRDHLLVHDEDIGCAIYIHVAYKGCNQPRHNDTRSRNGPSRSNPSSEFNAISDHCEAMKQCEEVKI